jgi:ABC-type branched-subunit amino acid transport system ATPase component
MAVLLAEQSLRFARRVADRAYILQKGRCMRTGGIAELAEEMSG